MKITGMRIVCVFLAAALAQAGVRAEPAWELSHTAGRVMLRPGGSPRIILPKAGRALETGEALITGDQARLELREGEAAGGGLWRVGRRAVFERTGGGWRLMAGTALARVPDAEGWRVESARGAARLGKGLWILQAVDNEGLKIVCLNGPAWVEAAGGEGAPARIRLKPGELVFLAPGGREFGPVVTIYLEELLFTSRLVNGFPEPLAESRRLLNLGVIQREKLKLLTGATVAGARDEEGFQIAVPKGK